MTVLASQSQGLNGKQGNAERLYTSHANASLRRHFCLSPNWARCWHEQFLKDILLQAGLAWHKVTLIENLTWAAPQIHARGLQSRRGLELGKTVFTTPRVGKNISYMYKPRRLPFNLWFSGDSWDRNRLYLLVFVPGKD